MFERVFVGLNRWLLILLLAAIVVIVFANVVLRYVIGTSVIWSSLFTVGNFLYGRTEIAYTLLAVFVVSGLGLITIIRRLWA